ncbi:MAG TPA: acyl-CoA dehydrogenase, partial [Mycobacterium sp.]|nr:acyl-CoA dehydrogenase [Mycobacterium sp.]
MDVRLTREQQQLRDAAAKLADDLGPGSVADLDDAARRERLEKTVALTGWRNLRTDEASGVEVAIVAEEFARGLVDVPFAGPVLADDLHRLLGRTPWRVETDGAAIDLTGSLAGVVESPPELAELSDEDADRW